MELFFYFLLCGCISVRRLTAAHGVSIRPRWSHSNPVVGQRRSVARQPERRLGTAHCVRHGPQKTHQNPIVGRRLGNHSKCTKRNGTRYLRAQKTTRDPRDFGRSAGRAHQATTGPGSKLEQLQTQRSPIKQSAQSQ